MHVLVTGGAGYIGAHTTVQLLRSGVDVTVLDNFCNSSPEILQHVESLGERRLHWVRGDVRDADQLNAVFSGPSPVDAVMHFAGLKAAGESVNAPLRYYDNNVIGTLRLVQAMQRAKVHTLIFSSTAAVYGNPAPERLPLAETSQFEPTTNPYAFSKWITECYFADLHAALPHWRIASLRYFNAVGAHPSGKIGETSLGTPSNVMPYLSQVASGIRPALPIFGNDYPTLDGTGVRDYTHVMDLADGHIKALKYLTEQSTGAMLTLNLGTGRGHSVLELVRAFEAASGITIACEMSPRRAGDIATSYADVSLAKQLLGWQARRSLADICRDTWRWESGIYAASAASQRCG